MANLRSAKWDILKFTMMFFVVLGHCAEFNTNISENIQRLFLFIYTFHMPVFIFVSGLFSKKTVNEKRKEKILGYFVLYVVSKGIFFTYNAIANGKFSFSLFKEGGLPWFMLALFAFSLITILLKNVSPAYVLAFSILLACLSGYDKTIFIELSLSRLIVYYPFYYLGYCLDPSKLEVLSKGILKKLAAVAIIAITAVLILKADINTVHKLHPLLTGTNPFSSLGNWANYGFLLRLGSYAVSLTVGAAWIVIMPSRTPFGIAEKCGKRTLSVYLIHYVVLYILYNKLGITEKLLEFLPMSAGWHIIPLALVLTVVLSLPIFDKAVNFIGNVPMKKS